MALKLNYEFKNNSLLEKALTHSSYANESKRESNERLEFLGDAVLELVISDFIYNKFPELPEGELSKLRASIVCEQSLAEHSRRLGLGEKLALGKGEEQTGGRERESILENTFEAVIGAIYLDGGFEDARKFILGEMKEDIFKHRSSFRTKDSKTVLQELIQKNSKIPVEYIITGEEGPDHNKRFIMEVKHEGKTLGRGNGKSKKEAEQIAAADAIKNLTEGK